MARVVYRVLLVPFAAFGVALCPFSASLAPPLSGDLSVAEAYS
jgi:hypothetical protein